MGELGPREERWRRVSHLTGGGHPLTSQSTSVTAPPLTTVPPCSCSCCTTTHTHSVVPPKQGLDRNWFSPVVRLVELLGAGRDTHWTSGSSQTPPRRRRHLKPLISFGQILERISLRKSPTWSFRFFGEVLLFPKQRNLSFFSNSCHQLSPGDSERWWQPAAICRQHVFWGGQTTNSQCSQIVNVHK